VELVDDGVPPGGDPGVVVLHLLGGNAELRAPGGHPVVQLRGFEQGFGGDAADVQARAAELVRFDQSDLQSELGGADRGGVTAHSSTENGNVEIEAWHFD
jgi:hypothetical protein